MCSKQPCKRHPHKEADHTKNCMVTNTHTHKQKLRHLQRVVVVAVRLCLCVWGNYDVSSSCQSRPRLKSRLKASCAQLSASSWLSPSLSFSLSSLTPLSSALSVLSFVHVCVILRLRFSFYSSFPALKL